MGSVGWGRVILALKPSNSVFCAWAGLDEGISSTIFVIIIVALGVAVLTLALCFNYQPCKIERQKLPSKQKEKNKEEESQFAIQQAKECNARNC